MSIAKTTVDCAQGVKHMKRVGFYPEFKALWHLKALGVVHDLNSFHSAAWKAAADSETIKVVVMDTTVDWAHPNLAEAINIAEMRDFSAKDGDEEVARLGQDGTLVEAKDGDRITTPTIYGAHGTCVSGLIGARPAMVSLQHPDRPDEGDEGTPSALRDDTPVPYIGINPFCEIVPVSLTAAPDPAMVMAALNYIAIIKPQIVVVAAAWDYARYVMTENEPKAAMDKSFSKDEPGWDQVEEALEKLCKTSLVFCAAGNSGADAMAYPARLSGTIPNLIAVTACDQQGRILNYAYDPAGPSGALGQVVVMRTMSSDHPRYDRDSVYLDPYAAVDPYLKVPAGSTDFPPRRIISCDPRGNRGYNPSKYRYTPPTKGPHLELASLFAEFSGTSAATAIAAGLVSLAMQAKGVTDISKVNVPALATTGMFGICEAMAAVNSARS